MSPRTILKLGKRLQHALGSVESLEKDNERLKSTVEELSKKLHHIDTITIPHVENELGKHSDGTRHATQRVSELEHAVRLIRTESRSEKNTSGTEQPHNSGLFADDHINDEFYVEFENLFRGSEDEIKNKQRQYVQYFSSQKINYTKHPVIDVGSGRGEFLELMSEANIRAIGVDMNKRMTDRSIEKGLEAVNGDAVAYLAHAESHTIGGVIGFQIAEHLPFEVLMELISESYRALVPGGKLILETPNPESLNVGANTFNMDPSHLKPIPPQLMEFMAKFQGFSDVSILRISPLLSDDSILEISKNPQIVDMAKKIYGPRDYAVIATKQIYTSTLARQPSR